MSQRKRRHRSIKQRRQALSDRIGQADKRQFRRLTEKQYIRMMSRIWRRYGHRGFFQSVPGAPMQVNLNIDLKGEKLVIIDDPKPTIAERVRAGTITDQAAAMCLSFETIRAGHVKDQEERARDEMYSAWEHSTEINPTVFDRKQYRDFVDAFCSTDGPRPQIFRPSKEHNPAIDELICSTDCTGRGQVCECFHCGGCVHACKAKCDVF